MKLNRFHRDIYCPDWAREKILEFSNSLKDIKLTYSYHALNKVKNMSRTYKKYIRNLIETTDFSSDLYLDYVFEWYADKDNNVRKVCYRFPTNLNSDFVIVLGKSGKIITIYTNKDFDKHRTFSNDIYQKGETIESTTSIATE